MTVKEASGDASGDPTFPPPATVQTGREEGWAPECPLDGRFWVLQSPDEEEDGDADEALPASDRDPLRYFCQTPSSVSERDLSENSSELARRALKRVNRQRSQRMAARAAIELEDEGMLSPSLRPLGRSVLKSINKPVLEPSVFRDDSLQGWTVVHRRRWSPAVGKKVLDPTKSHFSNSSSLGPTRTRADGNVVLARWGPTTMMHRVMEATKQFRSNGDRQTHQVQVGGAVAGRAFRNLLGFAWRRIEAGAPVVHRRQSSTTMNGEDGQNFNPGRGGFNHGRGGFLPRGGYGGANGRGAYAGRGRQSQRGGRGGQGYGGGQGFGGGRGGQGNIGNNSFGRNFVHGEASGAAGMNNGQGFNDDNWGGGHMNYQRGASQNSNRFGYGANQQRWNSGNNVGRGGFQNRFRANPHGGVARGGIDADLLQQTVQAVVAAVTAAQKAPEVAGASQVHVTVGTEVGVTNQDAVVSVAAPTIVQQQGDVAIQEGTDPQVAAAKGKENEGPGPLKKKKEEKMGCFRCKKPGHYIDDCPTPFCDLCESVHHSTSVCHLLHAPKPTAIIHGYANEALMFFELPCGAFKAKVENPKLAKVTVDGDAMTIPEIIEQLKKIVPHEKFNWEVFHFKDNVFRVKLPSKQEVQRLKNFGTYICSDRESCLSFDLWSSLEEPLYMLPEVWVRVSGLPSDMRSDYLSLWGVGILFGKTLDVDMAYTRKNKVLRTKIGCLDRNLIPADSDVFIRRGFFKLKFEVETIQGSQEVNMVDANNGNDGNGDAHNGEGNNGGGNAMDMDPKRGDVDATSNNNDHGESNGNNGGDGMQEQLEHFDAIQIGSMNVKLTPPDSMLRGSFSGLHPVGPRGAGLHAASGQRSSLPMPAPCSWPRQGERCNTGQPATDAGARVGGDQRNSCQPAAACARVGRGVAVEGSSVAFGVQMAALGADSPRKIQQTREGGPGLQKAVVHNNAVMIGNDEQSLRTTVGSSVSAVSAANGMAQVSKNVIFLDLNFDEHSTSGFNSNFLLDDGNT
ncbi:hypothetical protein ACQ4PT_051215 [Festuca glaucescens]